MKNEIPQPSKAIAEFEVIDPELIDRPFARALADQFQKRINQLRDVISWSYQHGGLSAGQRICLHQEIASLMRDIDSVVYGDKIINSYKIPEKLQEKVIHILMVMQNTEWKKQELIKY